MVVSGDDGWTAGVALELIYKILRKFNICMAINVNELRNRQADTVLRYELKMPYSQRFTLTKDNERSIRS